MGSHEDGKAGRRKYCGALLAIDFATKTHELTRMVTVLRLQLIESQMTQMGEMNTDWLRRYACNCLNHGDTKAQRGTKGKEDCGATLAMGCYEDEKAGRRKNCGALLAIDFAMKTHELTRMVTVLRLQLIESQMTQIEGVNTDALRRYACK